MTNEDKIKSMSTEELARFLNKYISLCDECPAAGFCNQYSLLDYLDGTGCTARIKVWLMQEAKE